MTRTAGGPDPGRRSLWSHEPAPAEEAGAWTPDSAERWVCLILAAGKGSRMRSDLAKVLHEIDGRTLLGHVLDLSAALALERTIVVVGHQADAVRQTHAGERIETVLQEPQLGTGHAVLVAAPELREEPAHASLLVLYGDVPLLRSETVLELMERHRLEGNAVTVLTARVSDPTGYGRVFRTAAGDFDRIVEHRDLDPADVARDEINSGIYCFRLGPLLDVLDRLRADNAQGEYYLTDALQLLKQDGGRAGIFCIEDAEEISGINTLDQLDEAGAILRRRRAEGIGCGVCATLRDRPELVLERVDGIAVVLDPRPYNSGQLWVVPERHVTALPSLAPAEGERLLALAVEAERWLEESYHPQAFNLGYNSGRAGEHLRMQVIPRWAGDSNFMPLIGGVNILPETLAGSRRRILESRARLKAGKDPGAPGA